MRREQKPFKVETVNRNRLPPRRLFSGADPDFNAMDASSQYHAALEAAERLFAPPTSLPLETVNEVVAVLDKPEEPKETFREQRVHYPVEQNNPVEQLIEERRRSKVEKMRKTRASNRMKAETMDDIFAEREEKTVPTQEVSFEQALEEVAASPEQHEHSKASSEPVFAETVQNVPASPVTTFAVVETDEEEEEDADEVSSSFTEDDVEVSFDSVVVTQPNATSLVRKTNRSSGIGQRWMDRRLGKWAKHALRRA